MIFKKQIQQLSCTHYIYLSLFCYRGRGTNGKMWKREKGIIFLADVFIKFTLLRILKEAKTHSENTLAPKLKY